MHSYLSGLSGREDNNVEVIFVALHNARKDTDTGLPPFPSLPLFKKTANTCSMHTSFTPRSITLVEPASNIAVLTMQDLYLYPTTLSIGYWPLDYLIWLDRHDHLIAVCFIILRFTLLRTSMTSKEFRAHTLANQI
jgi:hypothetical protein